MPTEAEKKRRLLDFLQQRVFGSISRAKATGPDATFIRDAQRAVERTAARYPNYGSAAEVKGAFISDLRSEVGQKLAALLQMLNLPRFEDIETEFMSLCRELSV